MGMELELGDGEMDEWDEWDEYLGLGSWNLGDGELMDLLALEFRGWRIGTIEMGLLALE